MKTYQLTNRHTQEVKTFKSWTELDLANLDIRTWGRPILVTDKPLDTALTVLKKVYINPTLWSKDVIIRSLDDLTGIYFSSGHFHYMRLERI